MYMHLCVQGSPLLTDTALIPHYGHGHLVYTSSSNSTDEITVRLCPYLKVIVFLLGRACPTLGMLMLCPILANAMAVLKSVCIGCFCRARRKGADLIGTDVPINPDISPG